MYMTLKDFMAQICDKCQSYMIIDKCQNGYLKCPTCGYKKMSNPIITLENYITSNGLHPEMLKASDYTKEIQDNTKKLLDKVNAFLNDLGIKERKVNSGWRSPEINAKIPNAAKNSNRLKALAVDLEDSKGDLRELVLKNLDKAKQYGIYFEDMRWTKTWLHLQIVPPGSGKRIYIPSTQPMTNPNVWSGTYPHEFD